VAAAGAAVGREQIRALEEREFPAGPVVALAPESRSGDGEGDAESIRLQPLKPEAFQDADIAFFCGEARISKEFAAVAVDAGAYAIDLSAAFRSDPGVPLCAPPTAPFVRSDRRIATCPDPLAISVARALAPVKARHP